jgi:hypothetical protein
MHGEAKVVAGLVRFLLYLNRKCSSAASRLSYLLLGHFSGEQATRFGGFFEPLIDGKDVPGIRLDKILGYAVPLLMHPADVVLTPGISSTRGQQEPLRSFGVVLRHAFAAVVDLAKMALCGSVAALRSTAIPI